VLKIRRRIELLEEALLPVEPGPPLILTINGVESDGTVASTIVLTVPQPASARPKRPIVGRRAPWATRW
jgi:hypothetical protein